MKNKEATLLGYKFIYNRAGKLVTERTSTDIKKLKPYLSTEEYETLKTVVREGTVKLDEIHNYLETNLNARIMTD